MDRRRVIQDAYGIILRWNIVLTAYFYFVINQIVWPRKLPPEGELEEWMKWRFKSFAAPLLTSLTTWLVPAGRVTSCGQAGATPPRRCWHLNVWQLFFIIYYNLLFLHAVGCQALAPISNWLAHRLKDWHCSRTF